MFFSIVLQAALIVVMALPIGMRWGWSQSGAYWFGGSVALMASGMLLWRWHQGRTDYHCDGERHLKSFYRAALARFGVVVVMLAAGLAGLGLAPLPLLTGFIVGQLAWVIAAAVRKTD